MTVTGLHHASLTVADLDRSLHFYRDLLGVPVREQVDAALVMVEGDQPVAQDERGGGQR